MISGRLSGEYYEETCCLQPKKTSKKATRHYFTHSFRSAEKCWRRSISSWLSEADDSLENYQKGTEVPLYLCKKLVHANASLNLRE